MSMKFLKTVAGAAVSSLWEKVSGKVVLKDTSANVGIGTDSPDAALQIHRSGNVGVYITSDGDVTDSASTTIWFAHDYDGTADWAGIHFDADNILRIGNEGTSNTNHLTIDESGNVTVGDGNLVVGTAGKGIDFSAQTPASGMTAELLDHYEEGTWTGVISDGTNNATMDASITTGTYTRIGNQVTASGYFSSTSLGSVSGNIRLTGLPFASADNNRNYATMSVGYGKGLAITANQSLTAFVYPNTTFMFISLWDATGGSTTIQDTEWTDDGGFVISGSYMVS